MKNTTTTTTASPKLTQAVYDVAQFCAKNKSFRESLKERRVQVNYILEETINGCLILRQSSNSNILTLPIGKALEIISSTIKLLELPHNEKWYSQYERSISIEKNEFIELVRASRSEEKSLIVLYFLLGIVGHIKEAFKDKTLADFNFSFRDFSPT